MRGCCFSSVIVSISPSAPPGFFWKHVERRCDKAPTDQCNDLCDVVWQEGDGTREDILMSEADDHLACLVELLQNGKKHQNQNKLEIKEDSAEC